MTRARDLASGINGVRSFAMAAGNATTSAGNGQVTITFPSGRFTVAPTFTASSISGGVFALYTEIVSVSSTSATVAVNADGSSYPNLIARNLSWQAVQMTSGAASG